MLVLGLAALAGCQSPSSPAGESRAATGSSTTLTGANGSVVVSGMSGTSLTVSYTPGATITSANLYVTQGNGTGLVLAAQAMTNSSGTYSYTFSNASFTSGAKIGLIVVKNVSGAETMVPQGTLSDATTWSSFTYGSGTTSYTYTVTFDSQGATTAASPSTKTVASPATTVGSLPTAPVKTGYVFGGWYTAVNGGGTAFTASTTVTASLTVYAKWTASGTVSFGPNVYIFDPSMSASTIQSQLNTLYAAQQTNQFGSNRYAVLFKPGTYNVNVNVGFYMQILGLGQNPDQTNIVGSVQADGSYDPNYAVTDNFWRSVENLAVTPTAQSYDMWAVSQASPMRRVHVKGGLWLFDINPNTGASGWASGGFLSDTLVDGQVNSGGQQQWFSRNAQWGSWTGSVWNMVFAGCVNAPASTFPTPPNTTVATTPVVKEKPYLYIDASGNYNVFVPSLRSNSSGVSWASGSTPGTSIPISQFYIAQASTDTAATINAALASGKHLLLTPGVYSLNGTIQVNNANTIVLGLGMATLLNTTAVPAMQIADVDGVEVAGVLFDAGPNAASSQLQVGPSGSSASHASNPTVLSDLFFRVGGAAVGKTTVSLQINSSNVIGDDFWIWRADHGSSASYVGWTVNTATNGLVVNGANVTIYGLAVEHYQQYQTLWNGNGGQVYFYQSEEPYDVPAQSSWMNGTANGYPSYKVANSVTSHTAYGVGVYCYFNVNPAVQLDNAFEVPTSGLNGAMMHNLTTVSLGGVGTINHILDGYGSAVNSSTQLATLVK
jgi:uncharacterized repeat protein (TIGR02543 family)